MFSELTTSQILVIIVGTAVFYGLIVAFVYAKKTWATPPKSVPAAIAVNPSSLIGPVIPTPSMPLSAPSLPLQDRGDDGEDPESEQWLDGTLIPDDIPSAEDQQATLLKEAERVVEEIQQAVDTVTRRPADPEEVFTKIHAIVSEYSFFFVTDYYDAINRFVAVTVQRDCDLEFSEDDIKALWYAAAA